MKILRQKEFGWFSKSDSTDKVVSELGKSNFDRIESLRKNLEQLGDFTDYVKKVDRIAYDYLYSMDYGELIYYIPYPEIWLDQTIFTNKLKDLTINKDGMIYILEICQHYGDDFDIREALFYDTKSRRFLIEDNGYGNDLGWVSKTSINLVNSFKKYLNINEILETFSYDNDEEMISDMKIKQKVQKLIQLVDRYTLELVKIFKKL